MHTTPTSKYHAHFIHLHCTRIPNQQLSKQSKVQSLSYTIENTGIWEGTTWDRKVRSKTHDTNAKHTHQQRGTRNCVTDARARARIITTYMQEQDEWQYEGHGWTPRLLHAGHVTGHIHAIRLAQCFGTIQTCLLILVQQYLHRTYVHA